MTLSFVTLKPVSMALWVNVTPLCGVEEGFLEKQPKNKKHFIFRLALPEGGQKKSGCFASR